MSQLQFLETVAKDNLENVNKHLLRSLRSNHKAGATDAREPYVFALQQETIHFAAKQTAQTVNRVFVAGEDYPQYKTVGWLLYTDVEHCVICNRSFGMFLYKYTCYACGNVVCNSCLPYNVTVAELMGHGDVRVCVQCCYGQDTVCAVHTYKDPNPPRQQQQQREDKYNNANMDLVSKAQAHVNASTPASMKSKSSIASDYNNNTNNNGKSNGNGSNNAQAPQTPQQFNAKPTGNLNSSFSEFRSNSNLSANAITTNAVNTTTTAATTDRESFSSTTSSSKPPASSLRHRPSLVISSGAASGYVLVTPNPGFVIKTWRTDDKTKVFVNITSHTQVPYNSEETHTDKEVYKIVGDIKTTDDKDGAKCVSVDVIVHPNEIRFCEIDSRSRMRLCTQSLTAIQQLFGIPLDPAFKNLKLVSNYKGDEISLSFIPKSETYSNTHSFANVMQQTVQLYKRITPAQALRESSGSSSTTAAASSSSSSSSSSNSSSSSGNRGSGRLSDPSTSGSNNSSGLVTTKLTPIPGFVIKTRDQESNKVFINVCHHHDIPATAPAPSSNPLSLVVAVLSRPCCYVFAAMTTVMDRDGGECVVIPCVVNSDTYFALDKHVQGATEFPQTTKWCVNLIKRWNEEQQHQISLGSTTPALLLEEDRLTYPKTKNGFKGDSDHIGSLTLQIPSNSGSSGTSLGGGSGGGGIVSQASTSALNLVSMTTNPMRTSARVATPTSTATSSGAASPRLASNSNNSSNNSSTALGAISVSIVPASVLTESHAQQHSHADPFSFPQSVSVPMGALFIHPSPGLCISARKMSGQCMYINILHNAWVGDNNPSSASSNGDILLCSMGITGVSYTASNSGEGGSSQKKKSLVLDVCVRSDMYQSAVNEDRKDDLVIRVLEFVCGLGVALQDEFDLLTNVPGSYVTPQSVLGNNIKFSTPMATSGTSVSQIETPIDPSFPQDVFNICTYMHAHTTTAADISRPSVAAAVAALAAGASQACVFVGELFKRGHGVKSWKRRKFLFSGRRIKYYEKNVFKGDFDVKDCRIEIPQLAESGAPTYHQFILHSTTTKGSSLICCADSAEVREQWIKIIQTQCVCVSVQAACVNAPPMRCGYLKKQGHVIRNWQRRYFVLDMGVLRYYEKCSDAAATTTGTSGTSKGQSMAASGENLKGQMGLAGSNVSINGTDRIYVGEGKDGTKDLLLQLEENDEVLCRLWVQDFQRHIDFATENEHLVDFESKE